MKITERLSRLFSFASPFGPKVVSFHELWHPCRQQAEALGLKALLTLLNIF